MKVEGVIKYHLTREVVVKEFHLKKVEEVKYLIQKIMMAEVVTKYQSMMGVEVVY
jgi:hypothetical protein